MKMLAVILLFNILMTTVACQQIVPGRVDVVASGTATVEVTASLRILDQLEALCIKETAPESYPSSADRDKAVADCVFGHLSSIGSPSSALTDFTGQYCGAGADLQGLTESELATIRSTCAALGK